MFLLILAISLSIGTGNFFPIYTHIKGKNRIRSVRAKTFSKKQ
jgi:hypothetical protein